MATVTLKGNAFNTIAELPALNTKAPEFNLTDKNLATKTLAQYQGKNVVLNIFPSIDTPTCAVSVRTFNQQAAALPNTVVLCISRDLPFAQARFCAADGIENVEMLSDFKTAQFGKDYGVLFTDGPLEGLLSRAVVVLNDNAEVIYTQQVAETADEPNYQAALDSLK